MAWFRITNNSRLPVHVQISWAGISEHYKNDLSPLLPTGERGYAEWDMGGAAAHDLTIVPASGTNQFTGDNGTAAARWVVFGVGILTAIAGVVLLPFSLGGSAALVAAGITATVAGTAVTIADVVLTGLELSMEPVTIRNLYAPDGYNIDIGGGAISYQEDDTDPAKIIVTGISPLTVHWVNNTTKNSGTETTGNGETVFTVRSSVDVPKSVEEG